MAKKIPGATKWLRKCAECKELFVMIKPRRFLCEVCWAERKDGGA